MVYGANRSSEDEQRYFAHQKALDNIQDKQNSTRKELAKIASEGDEASAFAANLKSFADDFFFSLKGQESNYYDTQEHHESLRFDDELITTRNAYFADLDKRHDELEELYRKQKREEEELIDACSRTKCSQIGKKAI